MQTPTPVHSIRDIHARYLKALELQNDHAELAVAAALDYCEKYDLALPSWTLSASSKAMRELLMQSRPAKRGRAGHPIARYRQDLIDYERWDTVKEAREKQPEVLEHVKQMRTHRNFPRSDLAAGEKLLKWAGKDWDRAYECAAMLLLGREAFASPGTIRASYLKVQKVFSQPTCGFRYFLYDETFLRKIGIPGSLERKQGVKIRPISDLTLP